jgi:hypothetical protein
MEASRSTLCIATTVSRPHRLYFDYVVCRNYSSPDRTGSTPTVSCAATTLCTATTTRHPVAPTLLRLRRASGRAVLSRVPGHSVVRPDYTSRGRNGYTSPTPRVRVPRHVTRLVTSHRRLLRLHRAFGCLGIPAASHVAHRQLLCLAQAHTPHVWVPRHIAGLVVDNFAYAARLGASAHRAARR